MSDLQCPARVILARHGEAAVPSDGGPRVLTSTGELQSVALAQMVADRRVAALWSSTLARAQQTAALVGERLSLPLTPDDRLRELMVDEVPPEGVGTQAGPGQDPGPDPDPGPAPDPGDVYAAWLEGELDGVMFGESGHEVVARLKGVVEEVADRFRGETVLLISHGGIIELGLPRLCRNLSRGFVDAHPLDNGEAAELEVDASGWVCTRWAGHRVSG
jgi:probable phosphoglycerate mutase